MFAHQIAGNKGTLEDYERQLFNTDERLAIVPKSISEFDASVAKASEIRQTQHSEFCHFDSQQYCRDAVLEHAINRLNKFLHPSSTRLR